MSRPFVLPDGLGGEVEAIACDLDRTLIAEDLVVRPRTHAALEAARSAGIHVVIATGRMFRSVRPYAHAAGVEAPVVCYQGAAVVEPTSGRFLLHECIPLESAREAIAALEAVGYSPNVYVHDRLYVSEATLASDRYARFQNLEVHPIGNLLDWLSEPPTKLVVIGDPLALDRLGARLRREFGERLFIAKSLPHFLEFANRGVSKGSGLAFVADLLGFSLERTVAFGDGENDLELLEAAGYGVAVAGGNERLLAIADLVCPAAEEEGVAQVIEELLAQRAG
jgi:Cof subfamily protein (haloacid dehalogenase superfamily)